MSNPKLTEQQVREMRSRLASGEKAGALAQEYGISRQWIYNIRHGLVHRKAYENEKQAPDLARQEVETKVNRKVIELRTGGYLNVTLRADFFTMGPQEMALLQQMNRLLFSYEEGFTIAEDLS